MTGEAMFWIGLLILAVAWSVWSAYCDWRDDH
mgnify:CR=1 FL=1